ncbi:MAG: GspH/FimT family pseudopilin [Moraxellaceae bacterium]|nr:GspH/FimT family pseudopilin [Moraxellaceae bacterium]MCP5176752.1 GspH/FimT family pseudopilin [Moraxellaceae bacterium]HQV22075.1 GspH/FimT family pseudopilin [Agitococcus sp.]
MPKTHGFTLIEALITITILCIITLFAHANLSAWLKTQNAKRVTSELIHIVHASRAYAITGRRPFTLCGSSNGLNCDNQWAIGALFFEDANRNGIIDNNDQIIRYTPLNTKTTLQWKGFGGQRLVFESTGLTSASNGTFTYCEFNKDPLYSRQVIVSRGGRARLSPDKNNDGIYEDINGNIITCPN